MRTAIIIPALNEEQSIAAVLRSIPRDFAAQIIVVDNGSSDQTSARAREAGAEVVTEPKRGYGRACLAGLAQLRDDIEAVAFLDADGSDDPTALPQLLEPIERDEADFVVSARTLDGAKKHLTPQQRFGNALACGLIRLFWGHRFSDLGPMRVIRRDALEKLKMSDLTWGWTVEMQIKAVQHQLRIQEIPVVYRERAAGKSKISGTLVGSARAGAKILATIGGRWLQDMAQSSAARWMALGFAISVAGFAAMIPNGDFRQPQAVINFLLAAAIAVAGYIAMRVGLRKIRGHITAWGWFAAVVFHLLLLPMFPSDDIWRYMWEGKMQNLGFNVYAVAPISETLSGYRDGYWQMMNHRDVVALYPLGTQTVFRALAAIGYHPMCFKLAFIAANLGAIWFLRQLLAQQGLNPDRAWWYAWNPLVVYSIAGGGHFDSLMIVSGLAGLWFLLRGRDAASMACLGLAISFKLVFVLAIPFFFVALRKKIWILLLAPFLAVVGICYATMPPHPFVVTQTHLLGVMLFGAGALGVYALWWRKPLEGTHHILGWLLMVSPPFHGWYLTWVLALSPLVNMKAWWILSVSAFAYFWVYHGQATTGTWDFAAWIRCLVWIPFYLALLRELTVPKLTFRWQTTSS
jgi:hypothetical protein